jgi:uncharacterized protein
MVDRPPATRALPRLREFSLSDLDGELAVFPLPGALLLPRGRLPLNIFEPRYVAMVDDALSSRRLIGMVQPQGVEADDEDDAEEERSGPSVIARDAPPLLYQVGCAGRLTSFVEREDGSYAITLAGIARFKIRRELETVQGYRRVLPDFTPFADDLVEPGPVAFDREALIAALRRFFALRGFEARWEAIEQMDDETLIVTLSMICPFLVAEKQALLEVPTLSQRAHTLLALLQMAGHETDDGRKPHAV